MKSTATLIDTLTVAWPIMLQLSPFSSCFYRGGQSEKTLEARLTLELSQAVTGDLQLSLKVVHSLVIGGHGGTALLRVRLTYVLNF